MNTHADRVELQSGTIIGLGLLKEVWKSVTELIGTIDRDRDRRDASETTAKTAVDHCPLWRALQDHVATERRGDLVAAGVRCQFDLFGPWPHGGGTPGQYRQKYR